MAAMILVVEEDHDLCSLFGYTLRIDGYEPMLTYGLKEAQETFNTEWPDLIIYDWTLSDTNGYLWIDDLRAEPATAHIPILLVCNDAPPRGLAELLDEIGIPLLEKPFDLIQFREHVAALMTPRERVVGA